MVNGIIDILLAEDSPDDIEITKRALKDAKVINRLFIVNDGQEALDFLFRQGAHQDPAQSPEPGLVLLDINMPKINGIEVLKKIKETDSLKHIPVVILTVSRRDEDVIKSYNLGCNSFIQKPVDFNRFVDLVKEIELYWGLFNIPFPKNNRILSSGA